MDRRNFLTDGNRLGGAIAALLLAQAADQAAAAPGPRPDAAPDGIAFTMFSRHLQWVSTQGEAESSPYEVGVRIGETAQEIGYRWVDLTVRSTGHVDPSRVDVATNLPLMLAGLRSTGARCRHMTCNISVADAAANTRNGVAVMPEQILQVANDNGIELYRWAGFGYSNSADAPFGKQVLEQLDAWAASVASLAALNRRYGMTAIYHTSSGGSGPRSVWDLMYALERFDASDLALNFDIGHMVLESALSSWGSNVRYALPYIKSLGMKDSLLSRNASGSVGSSWAAAGQGMVQWQALFKLLLDGGYSGPAEAQYEYNVTGLNNTSTSLNTTFWSDHAQFNSGNLTRAFMVQELAKDLNVYRQAALAAGWPAARLS